MANERFSMNLDKLGTVHKKEGKIYLELNPEVEVFEGKKGNYVSFVRWENSTPDQFGHTSSMQLSKPQGSEAPSVYVANGKPFGKGAPAAAQEAAPSSSSPFDSPF